MDSQYKVSIIIPVYNNERYLTQCLRSVTEQSLEEIEIIVINDCSKDGSLKIIQAFIETDDRVKLINNSENIGSGSSRNKATKKAKGEYILFVDADDWIDQNTCKILYELSKKYNLDVLEGDPIRQSTTITAGDSSDSYNPPSNLEVLKGITYLKKFKFIPNLWVRLMRTEFVIRNEVYCYPGIFYQDSKLSYLALTKANRISKIDFKYYHYNDFNTTSATNKSPKDKNLSDRITIINYFIEQLSLHGNDELATPIKKIMIQFIQPTLGTLRKYRGGNSDLKTSVIKEVKAAISLTKPHFLSLEGIPYLKKLLIYYFPKTYVVLFGFLDKLKILLLNNIKAY